MEQSPLIEEIVFARLKTVFENVQFSFNINSTIKDECELVLAAITTLIYVLVSLTESSLSVNSLLHSQE